MAVHTSAEPAPVVRSPLQRPVARRLLRDVVVAAVGVHALIHLIGALEGFGLADVSEIGSPGPVAGVLWTSAALAVGAAALGMARRWPHWWVIAGAAAVVSQVAVQTAWQDARVGTAVNSLLAAAALYGWAADGPRGMRATYRRHVAGDLAEAARQPSAPVLTEQDLGRLPPLVAELVRRSGAVGRPRVGWFGAQIHGRIRSDPRAAWMPFEAEQVNTFGVFPTRTFLMDATKAGMPVDVLHRFGPTGATMRARLCSIVTVVDESGPEMDQAETVTVLNDAVIFAPAVLVDLPLRWAELDEERVQVSWTIATCTATAVLVFDAAGDLVDFVSDDRRRTGHGERDPTPVRWSTPVGAYRSFGPRRLPGAGHGRWHLGGEGAFTYIELTVDGIQYGPAGRDVVADLTSPPLV